MAVFSDIALEWGGKTYPIPADRVMKAIAVVEEHITLPEFLLVSVGRQVSVSKLCAAYGALLRYAGARVSDEEVYESVFKGGDLQGTIIRSVNEIMQLMIPPATRAALDSPGEAGQETSPGNSPATTAASSSKRTKRRSR